MVKVNKIWLILVAALAAAVVVLLILNFTGSTTSTNKTETITYLEKNKEIALVTLGIADIFDQKESTTIFGKKLVGSDKHTFIKATFEAKLGIDGKNVTVKKTGEKEYEINIPKFIFIGYDNPNFEHVADDNGVLSFVTKDINQTEMVNKILDVKGQDKYIEKYTELLKESAEEFYKNLLPSFDKDAKLKFNYEN
jgi:hypothetical protein